MKITSAEFIKSGTAPSHYPDDELPEIAFAGRSNVGKSSLINALLNRKRLARTSNTPGRTQHINFFSVNSRLMFVDLPGYGYARVPAAIKKQWGPMVETYLREREKLCLVVVILDIRRDLTEGDRDLLHWLSVFGVDAAVVLTKADKMTRNAANARRRDIGKQLDLPPENLILFSARTGAGREDLWKILHEKTNTL